MNQERSEAELKREAAQRLLSLQKRGETDAAFARRLGLTPQHIHNYKSAGLSLGVLARIAGSITRDDLLYVITGKRGRAGEDALRDEKAAAFDRIVADVVREVSGISSGPAAPATKRDEGAAIVGHLRQLEESLQAGKKARKASNKRAPADPPKRQQSRHAGSRGLRS